MSQSYGKIKEGDLTIIENIPILFEFKKKPRSGLSEWHGSFKLPIEKNIRPGVPYRLILDDGRAGDIIITNIGRSSFGKHVINFKGSSLLA